MIWRRGGRGADDPAPDGGGASGERPDGGGAPEGGAGHDGPDDPGHSDDAESHTTDLTDQRRALIDLVIYAYDRATSTGVRARLADGLRRVGVDTVQPDGEAFDASRHEAGGVEPTDDDDLHDHIAETERAGFVDGDRVIRDPIVVVYRRR